MPLSVKHCCLAVAIVLSLAALPALAQSSASRYELSLPAQPLGDALIALGKAAHVSIAFEPAAVAGLRAPVLQGNYTPGEALQQLLKASGLSARQTAGGSYAVEVPSAKGAGNAQAGETKAPGSDAKMLDEVRVTATVKGFSATRMPTALKDVPQSVSIIDQQTLREQNANEAAEAFRWTPGITLQKNGAENTLFFSRGFGIGTIHIDGGGPLDYATMAGQLQRIDMSEYEQIEVLRGADALFGGVGDPGGSINLTRKRPLAENAASVAVSAGSWDHYRVEADLSGKLSGDGRLRGRMVAVDENQHYFYKTAQRRMNKLYAVTEYDLLPGTRVTLGGSYEHTPDFVQNQNGLPRYLDGRDAHLPRSTALTFPWAKSTSTKKEGFLQLEHSFSERWKLKGGVTRTEQVQSAMYVTSLSAINPVTKTIAPTVVTSGPLDDQQTAWDLSLLGSFDWNSRKQEVMFGADATQSDQSAYMTYRFLQGPPVNLFRFDPAAYAAPTAETYSFAKNDRSREHGVFASIKLRPADGWAITAGARSNFYRTDWTSRFSFGAFQLPSSTISKSDSGVITPFLGAVYELSPTYSLYASYADTTQGATAARTTSGRLLDPPRGTNKEFGLKGASRDGWLSGSLAVFDIRKINVAQADPSALLPIANCCYLPTTQRSKGFEAELNGRLTPGWQLSGGYTLNINRSGDGSTLSTITPKHLLKLWTNYRLPGPAGPWEIGGGVIAQSENYKKSSACPVFNPLTGGCASALVPFRAKQGFYTVVALRAGYRLNEQWSLALNIDNLFDRRYYATVSGGLSGFNFYGEPRSWMLTLRGEY